MSGWPSAAANGLSTSSRWKSRPLIQYRTSRLRTSGFPSLRGCRSSEHLKSNSVHAETAVRSQMRVVDAAHGLSVRDRVNPDRVRDPACRSSMSSRRHLASVAPRALRTHWRHETTMSMAGGPSGCSSMQSRPAIPTTRSTSWQGERCLRRRGDSRASGMPRGRYLRWSLDRHRLPMGVVRNAVLTVQFDRSRDVASSITGGHDRPFTCTVSIDDDRGRRHERVGRGALLTPATSST